MKYRLIRSILQVSTLRWVVLPIHALLLSTYTYSTTEKNLNSVKSIIVNALNREPMLRASKLRIASADNELRIKKSYFKPKITFRSSLKGGKDSSDDNETDARLGLELSNKIYDKPNRIEEGRAILVKEQEEHQSNLLEQTVIKDLVVVYLDLYEAIEFEKIAFQTLAMSKESFKAIRRKVKAGDETKTELRQAKARLALFEAEKYVAEQNTLTKRIYFKEIAFQSPPENLVLPKFSISDELKKYSLIKKRFANHPQITPYSKGVLLAREDLEIEKAKKMPRVDFKASYDRVMPILKDDRDSFHDYEVSLSLTWVLYEGGVLNLNKRKAIIGYQQAENDFDVITRQVDQDIKTAFVQLNSLRRVENAYISSLKAEKYAMKGIMIEFQAGMRTLMDVLDARDDLYVAEKNRLKSHMDVKRAEVSFLYAAGELKLQNIE